MKYALPWEKRNKNWHRVSPEGNDLVSIRYYPEYKKWFLTNFLERGMLKNCRNVATAKREADDFLKNHGFIFLTTQLANMS